MKTTAPFFATGVAVFATLAPMSVVHAEVTEKVDLEYKLAAGGSLSLGNANGSVHISSSGAADGMVRLHAVKLGETAADLKSTEVEVKAEPASLRIKTLYGVGRPDRSSHSSVDYEITIPTGVRLEEIRLENGDVKLDGLSVAGVKVACTNGRASARGLSSSGPVTLHNVNGNLDATLLALPASERVDLTDVNGDIHLTVPAGASATVRANTTVGSIKTAFGLKAREETVTGQKLDGTLGGGATPIHLETTNGSIRLDSAGH